MDKLRRDQIIKLRSDIKMLTTFISDTYDTENNFLSIIDDEITNMMKFNVRLSGPPDTPYHGIKFTLSVNISSSYPQSAPNVKFVTPILHPNVGPSGNICLQTLNSAWGPNIGLVQLMSSIYEMMFAPNPDSPLNSTIATLYKNNYDEYFYKVRQHSITHGHIV
jgi:ubiquitin-protein ligase